MTYASIKKGDKITVWDLGKKINVTIEEKMNHANVWCVRKENNDQEIISEEDFIEFTTTLTTLQKNTISKINASAKKYHELTFFIENSNWMDCVDNEEMTGVEDKYDYNQLIKKSKSDVRKLGKTISGCMNRGVNAGWLTCELFWSELNEVHLDCIDWNEEEDFRYHLESY